MLFFSLLYFFLDFFVTSHKFPALPGCITMVLLSAVPSRNAMLSGFSVQLVFISSLRACSIRIIAGKIKSETQPSLVASLHGYGNKGADE